MRAHLLTGAAAAALALAACSPGLEVHTLALPETGLTGYHTFQIVAAPELLGTPSVGATDPLLDNAMTAQSLRRDIVAGLERRGYVPSPDHPDLLVVYSLDLPPRQDVTDWQYGYIWRPASLRGSGPGSVSLTPAEYADGAVVIDLMDNRTGRLLWRGHGVADAPDDERQYVSSLAQSVRAVLNRLPESALALGRAQGESPVGG
jgi:hypothetical protein